MCTTCAKLLQFLVKTQVVCLYRFIVAYVGYGHDKPGPTDAEVAAKPTMSAYIVTENLECGTLKDKVLNQVLLLLLLRSLHTTVIDAPLQ